jgi:hypothetical protein
VDNCVEGMYEFLGSFHPFRIVVTYKFVSSCLIQKSSHKLVHCWGLATDYEIKFSLENNAKIIIGKTCPYGVKQDRNS